MTDRENALIVVGVDGSEQSLNAVRRALDEAELMDGVLHVVHVSDVTPAILHLPGDVTISTTDLAEARRSQVWSAVAPTLDAADQESVVRVDRDGYPADVLVDYCSEVGASLLVMGTRGRGRLAGAILGSTSQRALEQAKCDVLIVKGP